jgi:hypothetical protein
MVFPEVSKVAVPLRVKVVDPRIAATVSKLLQSA